MLAADFDFLELAQSAQAHVEDGFGLRVGELEALHQDGLRLILPADDADDLIEIEIGDEIAAEDFEPAGDFGEAEIACAGPARPCDDRAIRAAHRAATSPSARGLRQHIHVERECALRAR